MEIIQTSRHVLETTPSRWLELVRKVPQELLKMAPAPKEWSALDCLQHLMDTERWVFPKRIGYILAGQDFPAFHPESDGGKPAEALSPLEMATEFQSLRQDALRVLAKVTLQDLPRQARHAELGIVTLEQLLNEWTAHDLMHTVQAERAMMQPFIRGSGPWQVYFKDHTV